MAIITPSENKTNDSINNTIVILEAQGHFFKSSVSSGVPSRGGGLRGVVNGFSKASRKRLLETLARLDIQQEKGGRPVAVFLTLTFPGIPSPKEAKEYLFTFFKRVARRFPAAAGVWRLEFQKRGSPHFHVILFGLPYWNKENLQATWGAVIGAERPFTRIEAVRSWRGVLSYAAKYLGKIEDPESGGSGFNNVAYLTGRVWGVFNREGLPFGELVQKSVVFGRWFHNLKRSARRKWRGVNKKRDCGFSLFVDSPGAWVNLSEFLEKGGAV